LSLASCFSALQLLSQKLKKINYWLATGLYYRQHKRACGMWQKFVNKQQESQSRDQGQGNFKCQKPEEAR